MKKLILLLPIFFLNVITLWAQFPPPPSGPIADFVEINGTLGVGETLTGSYDYFDPNDIPEDGSTYQWYRADDEFGVGWTAISGAVDTTYILAAADDGKYISFEVTPSNGTETGMPAESMLEGPVGAGSGGDNIPPVASNVSFTGTLEVGATLTGSYNYSDADSDPEVGSLYIWYRNDGLNKTPIAGADSQTYTLVTADEGKNISFAVIPSDGIDAGSEEESSSQGPILAEPTPPTISFAGGTGSEGDPYQVATLEQLQALKDSPSFHYVLNNDLDASATSTWNSGEGFVPIGGNTPFTGSLDGQGFVITGLAIDRTTEDYVGLFAVIGDGGTVSNIGLEQLSISGGGNTGGLAGENNGNISGSYADGDVDGSAIVGGLVGLNNSTISKSYSVGTVDGTQDIGGLIGLHSLGTVSESYSSSNVTGSANNVGGLIGFSYDNVENSFATGTVSGDTNVGGFAGNYNSGTVSNSFSSGSVSGSSNVGGFIGQKNSFAAANNSFWDTQSSGQASATGIGSTTGIAGKTTAEMKTQSTYTNTGWDFTDTWTIDAGVNGGYPIQQDNLEEIVNSAPTGSVSISGTPQEDQILTASNTLADEDGLGAITYQWQRDGVNIVGATNSTYTLVQNDVGTVITVVASYTDGEGTSESVTSEGTDVVISSNTSPEVTNAIADFTVGENAPDSLIDLTSVFFDAEDNDGDLTYSAVSNSNPTLVSVTPNQSTDLLTLNFQADQTGTADITIRATDSGGLTADDSFTITVEEVLIVDPATAFITTWNTSAPGQTVTIPTKGDGVSDYDFTIDWGDGTVETYSGNEPVVSHTYTSAGDYEVLIGGTFPYFAGDETDLSGLTSIDQWGNINWEYMENMFYQATNLVTYSATDTPDLSGVSTLKGMFAFTGLSTADLSGWDVSTVTNFFAMFSGATSFNGDLSDWVFSADPYTEPNGLNFNGMFNLASSFSGTGLDTWDVSNADSLATMFADASAFDADLSGWDVSNVKDMFLMAEGAGLSTTNYTAMLSSWSALSVQDNVDLGVGETTYTLAGVEGRETLINTYNWTITDGGLTAGVLSLSTTETSPIDTSVTDTLWMDLTMDGTVVTEALTPGWTLTPAAGMTATGTPVYNETRQQWGYDLSGIEVSVLDQAYSLNVSASVSLENGTSSVDDNFSINITVPNTAPVVVAAIDDVTVDEDAADTVIDDLTSYFADAEESAGDLVYSIETNSNPTLLTASVNNTTDDLTLSYEANEFGTADITVRATDSGGLTADTSFTVTVNAVNDVPFFTKGSDQTVDENSGAQAVNGWASAISAGAANESGQALNFNISTNNDDLFSVLPVIDTSTGDLSYTPAADSFGVATVTINLSDDGGTPNGGSDTSADQTFIISVEEVLTVDPLTAFITTWNTSTPGETVTIPTGGGVTISDYNAIIDWGDGNIERFTGDDPDPSHTYATAGDYTVSIGGTFPHLSPAADGEMDQLVSVDQWGTNQWESMNRAFAWAKNMEYNATDTPDLSGVTDMGAMFFAAAKFNGEIGNWDVSTITAMGFAFDGASIFNGDISGWTVTNVTGMRDMFQNAAAFNQDLSSWDIRNVTNMLNFMDGTALSTANYNNMLSTWSTLPLTSSVNFSVGTTPYSIAGKTDRDSITDTFGWTITDGGLTANALSVSTMETSPVDLGTLDTLWIDLTIDDSVATDVLNPTWTLTSESGLTVTGTPVYNETREQWALDLSDITVVEYDREYTFDVSASVSLENGSSSIEDDFSINITVPNTAPIVDNSIGDFSIDEDATLDAVDLTIIFSDAEDNDADLNYSVTNSNPSILNATIDNENNLVLTLVADSSGTADVTIQAEDSGGLTVQGSFTLTINPVNDAPTVSTLIADVTVDENAPSTVIDLSTNFSDLETASSSLTYTVQSNDNTSLVVATRVGSELTLEYQTDQFGVATITVRASDGELSVDESFIITVKEINNAPVFAEAYDISTAVYAGSEEELFVGDQAPTPFDLTFNGDGTKLFVIGEEKKAVVEYNLNTPWDVSTAVYAGAEEEFNVGAQESFPITFTFKVDGMKLFVLGRNDGAVVEYDLSTAWDVSTATYSGVEFSVADQEPTPFDLTFNGDGTKLFVIGEEKRAVVEYDLSTAWDVSTTTYAGVEFYIGNQDKGSTSLAFNGSGTKLFMLGNYDDAVVEYDLSTAWDVSTMTYSGVEFYTGNQDVGSSNLTFNGDGTKMFVLGYFDESVVEYTLAPGTPRTSFFAENGTGTVIDVNATDGNGGDIDAGLTYSISGGADAAKFNIDASTGILPFKTVPDFENPGDADGNNEYEVIVQADDGEAVFNTATIALTVTVTDANEAPFVNSPIVDRVVDENDPNTSINLNYVFSDTEGVSTLTYSAESSNSASVVAIASGDSTLILSYKEFGSATITVTADDGEFSVADTFSVTVNEVLSVDPAHAFTTTWSTTSTNEKVTIPTSGGESITDFEFIVDWGDGSVERITGDDPDPSHTYATAGTHTVQIEGTFPYLKPNADGDLNQLVSIEQWGTNAWENMTNSFAWARNMEYKATDVPNLSNVEIMAGMFFAAEKLNGDFSGWNTSTVTDMSFMFDGAKIFNGNISTWDVSKVTNMREMFQNADSLNQDLSNWNVSSVTNMQGLFQNTASFNGDVSTWNTSAVTNMFGAFAGATSFNQDVSEWNVGNVTDFGGMFLDAALFNQDISNWDISSATRLDNNQYGFLQGSNISMQNYDLLLNKWSKLENVPTGLSLNVGEVKYGAGERYKLNLINLYDWTFTDGGFFRTFTTRWNLPESKTITIPVVGGEELTDYDFTIDWGDGTLERYFGDSLTISHTFTGTEGTMIAISGTFPAMNALNNSASMPQLTEVARWGDIEWESMAYMFTNATNLEIKAQDIPNLDNVSSMEGMFASFGTSKFNSDISGWDVSSITNMKLLFAGADAFNKDISSWDVDSVTTMESMFAQAASFDQNLGDWDVRNVETFDGESEGSGFMDRTALSTANYDSLLLGWADKLSASTERTVSFGEAQRSILSRPAYEKLVELGWTFNDGGKVATFTTRWLTTSANEMVTIPTGGGEDISDFDFVIDWGDGTIEKFSGLDDPDPSHTYAEADTHTVSITGVFPHMDPVEEGKLDQLVSLESWGPIVWESMDRMFAWGINMEYHATDVPDLSKVTDLRGMFYNTPKFNGDLSEWDVSNVEETQSMFYAATSFNSDISSWDVSNVTNMQSMFSEASSFNADISGWNVSKVTNMLRMFREASSFNQDLSSWDVDQVIDMAGMFHNATTFDQDLGDWDITSVEFLSDPPFGFLKGTNLSVANYDSLLIKWSQKNLPSNLTMDVDSTYYSRQAASSRQRIINQFDWTFNDKGLEPIEYTFNIVKERFSADAKLSIQVLGNGEQVSQETGRIVWTATNKENDNSLSGFTNPVFNAENGTWELTTRNIQIANPEGVEFKLAASFEIPAASFSESIGTDSVEMYNNFYFAENGFTVKAKEAAAINEQGFVIIDGEPVVHTRRNRAGLIALLNEDENNPKLATSVTTGITNMAELFMLRATFNQPIGRWDVSSVTNMRYMFAGYNGKTPVCTGRYTEYNEGHGCGKPGRVRSMSFNQDISAWDVSSVTNMEAMFSNSQSFNMPINDWDVSNVRTMRSMFDYEIFFLFTFLREGGNYPVSQNALLSSSRFNRPLDEWDVSSVTDMSYMFRGHFNFNQPIGIWDVSSVTTMESMFEWSHNFNQNIFLWLFRGNLALRNTKNMFQFAYSYNNGQPKNSIRKGVSYATEDWGASNLTNMAGMFQNAESFNQDISNWDVSSVQYFDAAPSESAKLAGIEKTESDFEEASISGDDSQKDDNLDTTDTELDTATGRPTSDRGAGADQGTRATNHKQESESILENLLDTKPDSIAGFLVGSGMSSDNASKMFVEWSKLDLQDGVSINIGSIQLNEEGANALRTMRQANNMDITWGGQEGVEDSPLFSGLPDPFEVRTEDTRILNLWEIVSDINTQDDQLNFKFDIISDTLETIGFNANNGEFAVTARPEADTFYVAIQVRNLDGIASYDTLEIQTDPNFTTSAELMAALPQEAELQQNYPNPFNPTTVIRYGVPQSSKVRLEVFDMLGRKVATLVSGEQQRAGWHQVNFDATRLASGMYLYRIVAGDYVQTRKMLLIK